MKISSFNDATTHGFLTRYNFGGVAVELEQMRVDGDLDAFGSDGDYDLRAAGIYAVYRTFGDLYFKARLGSLKEKASADIASFSGGKDDGVSGGIGAGYRFEKLAVELECTRIETDVDSATLGLSYKF